MLRDRFIRALAKLLRECGYEIRRVGKPRVVCDEKRRQMHEQLAREVAARRAGA